MGIISFVEAISHFLHFSASMHYRRAVDYRATWAATSR